MTSHFVLVIFCCERIKPAPPQKNLHKKTALLLRGSDKFPFYIVSLFDVQKCAKLGSFYKKSAVIISFYKSPFCLSVEIVNVSQTHIHINCDIIPRFPNDITQV